MVFPAQDMGDFHFQIIHDINEVEHGLAVGPDNDEIRVRLFAVGQFPGDIANDQVGNDDGLAVHLELDGALRFVGQSLVFEFLDPGTINIAPLRLEIRAVIAFAGARRVADGRAFVPIQAEPAQSAQDDLCGLGGVSGGIGVFHAQDERSAGVAGVKPVEQRRPGAANVQKTGWTGCKANSNIHRREQC